MSAVKNLPKNMRMKDDGKPVSENVDENEHDYMLQMFLKMLMKMLIMKQNLLLLVTLTNLLLKMCLIILK